MRRHEKILKLLMNINPEAVKISGYDDCIIGIANSFNGPRVIYSERRIIEKLQKEMSEKESWDYYEFKILNPYLGEYSPVFYMDITNLKGD